MTRDYRFVWDKRIAAYKVVPVRRRGDGRPVRRQKVPPGCFTVGEVAQYCGNLEVVWKRLGYRLSGHEILWPDEVKAILWMKRAYGRARRRSRSR